MSLLARLLPYALAFASSLCIMILELVSSRLVAPHVGSSLTVWTSVIGIILGGICLGNVLGGRLSDRVDPRRAVGPLFALGAFLTLSTLWINSQIPRILPAPDQMNWELRTVLVVLIDFLIPGTVLGMVGPVVAKIAVDQARRAGSAIGDVYFWGAVGSIAGTMLCGFALQLYLGTSTITMLVGAGLALLAAGLLTDTPSRVTALITASLLILGSIHPLTDAIGLGAINLGAYQINYLAVAGNAAGVVLAIVGLAGLVGARHGKAGHDDATTLAPESIPLAKPEPDATQRTSLGDLAVLAFLASLTFMALEMVAGRMVTRHMGSSIYGWSSVIAVLLAGLSSGNFLGGKIADFVNNEKQASWLFLVAAILTLAIMPLEMPPVWFVEDPGIRPSLLTKASGWSTVSWFGEGLSIPMSWPYRVLAGTFAMFFLPALAMGTVSPVVAKLAVDRLKLHNRTGTAIGQVYAWGMVGSILGTFLTGFVLIDILGTKGVILLLCTVLALGATYLGDLFHALFAGIPLGLCVFAFTPPGWVDVVSKVIPPINGKTFVRIGQDLGIREPVGNPHATDNELAWLDESDYYYIKVDNELEEDGEVMRRTLVLDNLIHGYFILNHPERLDYDYEHIYALVAYRAAKAGGKVTFKPAAESTDKPGASTSPTKEPVPAAEEPRTPKAEAPKSPEKPEASPPEKPSSPPAKSEEESSPSETSKSKEPGAGLLSVEPVAQDEKPTDKPAGKDAKDEASSKTDAAKVPPVAEDGKESTKIIEVDSDTFEDLQTVILREEKSQYIPPVASSELKTLFLGGGAYCFQRHMQFAYPGTSVDVAEIDPAVTRANMMATGLPPETETSIKTYWGDARQFVELRQDTKKYDLIFGDAFNDFSVPWHLTTREFNEKIKKMLTPNGVYMINIIDVYMSDAEAKKQAEGEIKSKENLSEAQKEAIHAKYQKKADHYGGFVGAWTKTALLTFGKENVYIFGTSTPGNGLRETFVVVASMKPLDLEDLGLRPDDPRYYTANGRLTTAKPYGENDFKTIVEKRSRGIVLTDDYAPVENLLAPVAETRGDKED